MSDQTLFKSEIDSKKVEIISLISQLEKFDLLFQIEELIKSFSDWWEGTSGEDKEKIKKGLLDIEEGRAISHHSVMGKAQEKIFKNMIYRYSLC